MQKNQILELIIHTHIGKEKAI